MPPKSNKAKTRLFSKAATKPTPPPAVDIPPPYKLAPKKLEPFLELLSKNHVYITHIDTKPRDHKAKIFAVPVVMNLVIIGLLLWRISIIGPFYMKICFSLMGKYNETTINPNILSLNAIGKEILRRAGLFMIDFLLYVFVWPWPRDFFVGGRGGSPTAWRVGLGFRDKDIIVRRSRKWDREIKDPIEEGSGKALLFANVAKAVDPAWMQDKTGYLMLNREWDLDWGVIVKATKLVDRGILSIDDFKTTILVHSKEFGWMVVETPQASGSAKEEEGRAKIMAFKDELTALGKESLFFRWIELVQFESSGPDGFGPEQQQRTMLKAKKMFEDQGVDFEKFWDKVGGPRGMPGMDDL
ncbi:hypothetical protein F5884DRAFT_760650 [Xylogone sp. PMI_703]|nr:hypothetical protein F5884DRAFT_760650 [Xylogone sp. PMI_703]